MLLTMMRAKLHGAVITQAELEYHGSLTVDVNLLEASGLLIGEKVQIVNLANGSRIETYLIEGERGKGEICLNGPAARMGLPGDSSYSCDGPQRSAGVPNEPLRSLQGRRMRS